ncbi:NAD(P)H dehydrogenase (quinone) [Forsythia ovata]|uniref:NAD(P)H dehydrogenase (quinone) n=1 Tax=Forsythia ovata TaxID=205694 RepID=A0ABD1VJL0_9LAMI
MNSSTTVESNANDLVSDGKSQEVKVDNGVYSNSNLNAISSGFSAWNMDFNRMNLNYNVHDTKSLSDPTLQIRFEIGSGTNFSTKGPRIDMGMSHSRQFIIDGNLTKRLLFFFWSTLGPLKNAIDWHLESRPPSVWADKAAAILSAGGGFGGGRAQYHLHQIGIYFDFHFINKPEFFLHAFQSPAKFDSDGNLIDVAAKERIKTVLLSLHAFTLPLQCKCE